jgi:hypothetical protein
MGTGMARAHNQELPLLIKVGSLWGGTRRLRIALGGRCSVIMWCSTRCSARFARSLGGGVPPSTTMTATGVGRVSLWGEIRLHLLVLGCSIATSRRRLEKARHTGRIRGAAPHAKRHPPTPNPYDCVRREISKSYAAEPLVFTSPCVGFLSGFMAIR